VPAQSLAAHQVPTCLFFRVRYASKKSIKKYLVGHTLESMISVAKLHEPHVVFEERITWRF
jgi:hypothetical protein